VPKRLLIQGCTGSIGRSVLSVVAAHRDRFCVAGLAARSSAEALFTAAREWSAESIALEDETRADFLRAKSTRGGDPRLFIGSDALRAQCEETDYDLLVNAVTGSAGLEPTAAALRRGIDVALANKETLVAAGPVIMQLARESGARILPIDSEHSAIFQCLMGERLQHVRRLWLTTSGGPFWGKSAADLERITVEEALAHPTWKMGPKITVDSATLFNKGLEVIEAERLFGIPPDCIEVVTHRQSVIHSLVEFTDGSLKAQLSVPDMRLPILFALTYPERIESDLVRTDVSRLGALTLEPVSRDEYPCLALCYEALRRGGTAPAALSAADEVAVGAFLKRQIGFNDIARVLNEILRAWPDEPLASLADAREADRRARAMTVKLMTQGRNNSMRDACC
jgi:1-deoxy-D-xylulose-5-phosphate reductoisomerase